MVGGERLPAGRRGGSGLGDSVASARSDLFGTCRYVFGPSGRLPELQEPVARRSTSGSGVSEVRLARLDRTQAFQPHVPDASRPGFRFRAVAYLRPETAQGIFLNFKNIISSTGRRPPFGIAQIGKAFRNEITPRNFIFRMREFEQMELEFFVEPGTDTQWHQYWVTERFNWWVQQGLAGEDLILHPQPANELAHYAKATTDILYRFPHGFEELEGIANRQDFDLASHTRTDKRPAVAATVPNNTDSTQAMTAARPGGENFIPYVIEPSAGVDRGVLAVLCAAYRKEQLPNGSTRVVLGLKHHIAPVKLAVLPLARNSARLMQYASNLAERLRSELRVRVAFEDSGNVGKAYRKHDEIGTPHCITVDYGTIGEGAAPGELDTVTVRDRDSMRQWRVSAAELAHVLTDAGRLPRN